MADEQAPWETSASGETAPWDTAATDDKGLTADDRAAMGDPSDPYGGASVGASEGAASFLSGIPATIAGGVGYLAKSAKNLLHIGDGGDPLDTAHAIAEKGTYQPRTVGGQAAVETLGDAMALPGKGVQAAADVVDPSTNLGQTIRNVGERAMFATAPLAAGDSAIGAASRVGGKTHTISNFGRDVPATETAAAPKAPPAPRGGPISAEDLKNGPDRLPASPEPAPGTPAPEATPAPAAAPEPPPAAPPKDTPANRAAVLDQLDADSGGHLNEVRASALAGNHAETAVDHAHASIEDDPGKRMAGVIQNETDAVKTASQRIVDDTGSATSGTEAEARQTRGTIIDSALTKIRDWYGDNVSKMYRSADAAAGGIPMTKFDNFHGVLSDPSKFTGAEGMQLHGDIQKMAQHFGLMGQDGFWKPTSAAQVEKFRSWVGEQYTPRTGKAIRAVKDALDNDVAAHAGPNFYTQARALRTKQDQMLEGPKGISQLIPEKNPDGSNSINRPVPVANVADHIADMPKEQFDHVVNVLHDSAKLGNGELAESSAAALREIKAHMAERLHESGSKGRDGKWNPYDYHKKLDSYKLKMPALFSKAEQARVQTVHDAGNILRMDRSYPKTAELQRHLAAGEKSKLRENLGNAAAGELVNLVSFPGVATLAEVSGLEQKMRDTFNGRGNIKKRAAEVEGRIKKLGAEEPTPPEPPAGRPGPVGPGRKQGGWIGTAGKDATKADLPAITSHEHEPTTGEHVVKTPGGETHAFDSNNGKDIIVGRSDTSPGQRGKGESTARTAHLADIAHERGGLLHSDTSVSPNQAKTYSALQKMGYDVKMDPDAVRTMGQPKIGKDGTVEYGADGEPVFEPGYRSSDPRKGVFTVGPKKQSLLDKFRGPGPKAGETAPRIAQGQAFGQRGAAGDIYDRTPNKDAWGNERQKNDRTPLKDERSSNPYDSGGTRSAGARAFVPKGQRGAIMDEKTGPNIVERINALKAKMRPLAEKSRLTGEEAKQFQEMHREVSGLSYDRANGKHGMPEDVKASPEERMSTLSPETNSAISKSLMSNKAGFLAVRDAAAGTVDNAETMVDHTFAGKNPAISGPELYHQFDGARDALRKQYGDTVPLYRAEGQQKPKHTTNWATTPEFAKQFGGKVTQRDVPVDHVLAANVLNNGKYHELVVGDPKKIKGIDDEPPPGKGGSEEPMVNIGLHVGDPANGGRVMDPKEAVAALKNSGVKVTKKSIQNSATEPTLVASLDRALKPEELHNLSAKLGQDAIAQRTGNAAGDLAGPKAADWGGKYNSEYFKMHDGRSALEHDSQNDAYDAVKQHLTPKEQADIEDRADVHRTAAVKNLLDTFHGSTSVEGVSAMALAGEAKKGWYQKAAKSINGVFGPDAPRFTALLAAMSPQTSVEMNFHNALRTFINWDKAGRPMDGGAIKKIMEDSSLKNPDSESASNVMDAWHQNGVRALTSQDPEHENFQMSGPKVDSFHKNLRGHMHEVTNDSWNAIATNIDQKLFSGAYRAVPGDIFGRMGFKSPTYMGVSAKVRAAAMQIQKLTGEKWTPAEVQETMWSFVKTAFEHAKATGKSIPELLKSGELNDELIRGTSDFHSLFGSPEHKGFLDDSRFGEAARGVAADTSKPHAPSKASTTTSKDLRPHLEAEGERLEQARQARVANRKARIGNIQVPF